MASRYFSEVNPMDKGKKGSGGRVGGEKKGEQPKANFKDTEVPSKNVKKLKQRGGAE